jgi:DNA-binding NarL/FixJ family response regulator
MQYPIRIPQKKETPMRDILIVDDNHAFREILRCVLLSRFPAMQIREAQDGDGAIHTAEMKAPDLVFADVRLKGENGFELTRRLKAAYPDVVIIMITSNDSPEYEEAAFDAGADFFVSKNASTAEDILQRVASIFPTC